MINFLIDYHRKQSVLPARCARQSLRRHPSAIPTIVRAVSTKRLGEIYTFFISYSRLQTHVGAIRVIGATENNLYTPAWPRPVAPSAAYQEYSTYLSQRAPKRSSINRLFLGFARTRQALPLAGSSNCRPYMSRVCMDIQHKPGVREFSATPSLTEPVERQSVVAPILTESVKRQPAVSRSAQARNRLGPRACGRWLMCIMMPALAGSD